MSRVPSSSAIAMGALGGVNATVGGVLGGLRNVFVVVVGGGVAAVAAVFVPRLFRLARHRFGDYAIFRPRDSALKKKGARADNKGARWKQDRGHRLASKRPEPSHSHR